MTKHTIRDHPELDGIALVTKRGFVPVAPELPPTTDKKNYVECPETWSLCNKEIFDDIRKLRKEVFRTTADREEVLKNNVGGTYGLAMAHKILQDRIKEREQDVAKDQKAPDSAASEQLYTRSSAQTGGNLADEWSYGLQPNAGPINLDSLLGTNIPTTTVAQKETSCRVREYLTKPVPAASEVALTSDSCDAENGLYRPRTSGSKAFHKDGHRLSHASKLSRRASQTVAVAEMTIRGLISPADPPANSSPAPSIPEPSENSNRGALDALAVATRVHQMFDEIESARQISGLFSQCKLVELWDTFTIVINIVDVTRMGAPQCEKMLAALSQDWIWNSTSAERNLQVMIEHAQLSARVKMLNDWEKLTPEYQSKLMELMRRMKSKGDPFLLMHGVRPEIKQMVLDSIRQPANRHSFVLDKPLGTELQPRKRKIKKVHGRPLARTNGNAEGSDEREREHGGGLLPSTAGRGSRKS